MNGLQGDGWWNHVRRDTAATCRAWVRTQLLEDPQLSDHDADRFIASLSAERLEKLIRRAVNGHGAKNF